MPRSRFIRIDAFGFIFLFSGVVLPLQGSTINVTPGSVDELTVNGSCSLREAIRNANVDMQIHADCAAGSGADIIELPQGVYTLAIPGTDEDASLTGDFDILDELTIQGNGVRETVVDGAGLDRVFHFPVTLSDNSISGLTITGGNADTFGGGIRTRGTITLASLLITGNTAGVGGGGFITGPQGTVTLTGSTVSGNSSGDAGTNSGGGILHTNFATLVVQNSTVSRNAAIFEGGGIRSASGTLTIENSTLSNNVSDSGGSAIAISDQSEVFIVNTLIDGDCSIAAPLTSNGGNLESPGNTCDLDDPSDFFNVDPSDLRLNPLTHFDDGMTPYHLLLPGSIAIDAGINASCLLVDQRGLDRPIDGDGTPPAICDIGSVEVELNEDGGVFFDGFESGDTSAWSSSVP